MAHSAGPLVVVITGASSGVGRATAHAFAKRGSHLALGARDQTALAAAAEECRELGGDAIFGYADVTDPTAVESLRDSAVAAFGHVDVWVNCAAVLAFGRFETMPSEAFRRVIETNLFGYAHGARAALAQFRAQGGYGTLINVGSVLGVAAEPYVSAYVTSKFGIRGLTACLRQETRDAPDIHVCAVLPAALDTPVYRHAANYMGRSARSIFPVYGPERAAKAIVRLADRPRREIIVGGFGHLLNMGIKLAPGLVEWAIAKTGPQLQFEASPAAKTDGNVAAPTGEQAVSGGWRRYWRERLFGRRR